MIRNAWAVALGLLLALAVGVAGGEQECKCSVEPLVGGRRGHSIRVGVSFGGKLRITEEVTIGVGAGVALTFTWGGETTLGQRCTCGPFCCPEPDHVRPVVIMDDFPLEVEVPDPLVPERVERQTRTVRPVPVPDRDEWIWERGPEDGVPPEECWGKRELGYTKAGVTVGFSFSAAYKGVTLSVGFTLPGAQDPSLILHASPCRGEESPKNYPPYFVESLGPVCIAPGHPASLVLRAYDPNGPNDIVVIRPSEPVPSGVSVEVGELRTTSWAIGGFQELMVREAIINLTATGEGQGGNLVFAVRDRAGERAGSKAVPVQVVQPLKVEQVGEPLRWRSGFEITFKITDPNRSEFASRSYILLSVGVKEGKGTAELVGPMGVHAVTSPPTRGAVTMYGNTAEVIVHFIPHEGAAGSEKVILSASLAGCAGVLTTFNGVELCLNTPKVQVMPAEARVKPGETVQAMVTASFPCPGIGVLRQISGPGDLLTVRQALGRVEANYEWPVPSYYAYGPSWEIVTFRAGDNYGGVGLASLIIWIDRPLRVHDAHVTVGRGSMAWASIYVDDGDPSPIRMDFPPFWISKITPPPGIAVVERAEHLPSGLGSYVPVEVSVQRDLCPGTYPVPFTVTHLDKRAGSGVLYVHVVGNQPPQVRGELRGKTTVTLTPGGAVHTPIVMRVPVHDPDGDRVYLEGFGRPPTYAANVSLYLGSLVAVYGSYPETGDGFCRAVREPRT